MANVSRASRMRTRQSSKEPLMHEKVMRKEQCHQNPEIEEDPEDQLPLSQLFMNKDRPSVAPSLVTLLDRVTHPKRKRSKRTIKKRFEKSAAHPSPVLEASHVTQGLPEDHMLEGEQFSFESGLSWSFPGFDMSNFGIRVNGCLIDDLEIPYSERIKYYNLCSARKLCLHNGLVGSINSKLVAGIISGIVNTADEIQACSLSTFQTKLNEWDKRLESFKCFGMEVGFLQERIKELSKLSNQFQDQYGYNIVTRRSEVMNEETRLNEEITSLETELAKLKEAKLAFQIEREHQLNRWLSLLDNPRERGLLSLVEP
nr:B3 domain-containing protein Os01g0234100-like [Ipomoea trifida]